MKRTSLTDQLERIFRHVRQGSIGTRRDYKKCALRFANWLSEHYNLQNLRNISNKHLAAYVQHMLAKSNSPGYIIKNLAAIRYVHDQLPSSRYNLEKDNKKLGVPERVPPGDRAWEQWEYEYLRDLAEKHSKVWISDILTLQRELGLRIHEAVRLYTTDVERAIRTGVLSARGKGGKVRQVKMSPLGEQTLRRAAARVQRGARLFVPEGEKAHIVIKQVQYFIRENRPSRSGEQLTSHGLRYKYAQARMEELKASGLPEEKAELQVSRELGHNRRRVTRHYTGK